MSNEPYESALPRARVGDDELPILFVAPPWGDALHPSRGLDLRRTTPPVSEVVERVRDAFPGRPTLVAAQLYETVEPGSLESLALMFDWSSRTTYGIDTPGRNHGLLLGTIGWVPGL